ncbi:MAG: SpoVA/SpoVAEb family sporulation membrane protein, partial [Lachnospiraceae bacterium]|nr:SpoVA/SpoVAEb family sporulation membrane protein [Lachnospiraceae bacterium]
MASEQKKEEYQEYVRQNSPKTNLPLQMAKAFVMGGVICCVGQFIVNMANSQFGIEKETAAGWCSMILILLSALLTGFNLYGKLVKWGGAGALVPITGFANSVVASAIEYKTEGQVYGI